MRTFFVVICSLVVIFSSSAVVGAEETSSLAKKTQSFQILQQILSEDGTALDPLNADELSAIEGLGTFFLSNIVNRVGTKSAYRQARYRNFFRWAGIVRAEGVQSHSRKGSIVCIQCSNSKNLSPKTISFPKVASPKVATPAPPPTVIRSSGSLSIGSFSQFRVIEGSLTISSFSLRSLPPIPAPLVGKSPSLAGIIPVTRGAVTIIGLVSRVKGTSPKIVRSIKLSRKAFHRFDD